MKKACSYCGQIHDSKYECNKKPQGKYRSKDILSEADSFRSSSEWKNKRTQILKRDLYLCVACRNTLPGSIRRFNNEELSVHHIRPLKTNYEQRLEDSNLITLCRTHHEMAESGEITAETLINLTK